jgi:hypothetical protein
MTRSRSAAASATVAVLLALAAGASRADVDARVAVRAAPATLVLASGARATLEIDAGTEAPPAVSVNVGRVENVRALGGGRFAADYLPPREAYPQIAIVAALAGDRCGWTSIPLVGRGIAVARSVPRSPIRVTIGEASFGPVTADARGEAQVPVVVPPGVRLAYHRGQPLDLEIPPTPHVHLLLARTVAPADAAQDVPLFAFAVTAEGGPRRGAPVAIAVSQGVVEGVSEVAPGTFAGIWRLPAGRPAAATATARIADDPSPTATVSVARPAGVPARLALEAGRSRFTAGEDGPVPLRIRVTDAAGNAAAAEPRIEATVGAVSAPAAAGPGRWEATLVLPVQLGAARRAEIIARAGGVEDAVAVELVPGPPVRLAVAPESAAVVADGGAEARVRVQVLDRFGNDVPVTAPQVTATHGAAVASQPDAAGGWVVRYRPVRARTAGTEVLSVRAGKLEGAARFDLALPQRRVGVAPKLGFAASTGGLRSAYVGAEAEYATRLVAGRLRFVLEGGTFVHDRTDAAVVADRSVDIHGRARYVPVVASLRWRERLGTQQALWASAGAGLAHVSAEVSTSGAPPQEESGAVAALQASTAWGMRLGPGMPFAEIRIGWHSDPRFDTLRGALTVFTMSVGYLYDAY